MMKPIVHVVPGKTIVLTASGGGGTGSSVTDGQIFLALAPEGATSTEEGTKAITKETVAALHNFIKTYSYGVTSQATGALLVQFVKLVVGERGCLATDFVPLAELGLATLLGKLTVTLEVSVAEAFRILFSRPFALISVDKYFPGDPVEMLMFCRGELIHPDNMASIKYDPNPFVSFIQGFIVCLWNPATVDTWGTPHPYRPCDFVKCVMSMNIVREADPQHQLEYKVTRLCRIQLLRQLPQELTSEGRVGLTNGIMAYALGHFLTVTVLPFTIIRGFVCVEGEGIRYSDFYDPGNFNVNNFHKLLVNIKNKQYFNTDQLKFGLEMIKAPGQLKVVYPRLPLMLASPPSYAEFIKNKKK